MNYLADGKKDETNRYPYIIAYGQSKINIEQFYQSIEGQVLRVSFFI